MSDAPLAPFRDDIVALFPGQGSISGAAGAAWSSSRHWNVLERISAASGLDVEYLLTRADNDEVVRTDRAQIATFALSIVSYLELVDRGVRPRYLLGHSLGEFSALVASGLLSVDDGARLIGVRGAAMARAAREHPGSMVALMGGDDEARRALDTFDGIWVANINGSGQIVVSGTSEGLDRLLAAHRELGWRRATPLNVGGAFHSPLMASAQGELDAALDAVQWGTTDATLIANVDARVHTSPIEWRTLLSRQLTSPVEFLEATLALPDTVTTSIEMAPAGVLTGLTKRIRPFATQYAPSTLVELQELTL
ncbi:MAG TPA: ACP S-malonyltransferase [Acidimicrobiales bacterium]|nr:ACP S-malonyltransferase [Acidimicrobiales bacterium]